MSRGWTKDFHRVPWTLKTEEGRIVQTHENLMFLENIGWNMYSNYKGTLELWKEGHKVFDLERPLSRR